MTRETRHTFFGALEALLYIAAMLIVGLGAYAALILSGASDPPSSSGWPLVHEVDAPGNPDPAAADHFDRPYGAWLETAVSRTSTPPPVPGPAALGAGGTSPEDPR